MGLYINNALVILKGANVQKMNTLHKKWSFPLRIFTVNVTKSAASYQFGHIY